MAPAGVELGPRAAPLRRSAHLQSYPGDPPEAQFLASTVAVLVRSGRALRRDVGRNGVARRPALWGSAAGAVLIVPAVLVAHSGKRHRRRPGQG
ncbi:hypothetical protein [Streptomyces sp. NPDC001401]|uniref:hypothetical protein n=1 Tax=Streptomyces sp. NPDC001401 TaxID=3364570 RepID=UPI00368862C8